MFLLRWAHEMMSVGLEFDICGVDFWGTSHGCIIYSTVAIKSVFAVPPPTGIPALSVFAFVPVSLYLATLYHRACLHLRRCGFFIYLLFCWAPPPPTEGRSPPCPSPADCRGCGLSSGRLSAAPGPGADKTTSTQAEVWIKWRIKGLLSLISHASAWTLSGMHLRP